MCEVQQYPHGAPCWVDTWQPDPGSAREFYRQLFGWKLDRVPGVDSGDYLNCSLGGQLVAGIGHAPPGTPAVWTVNICVDRLESTIGKIVSADGRLLVSPVNVGEEGCIAIASDRAGAAFAIWEPGRRAGVGLLGVPNTWAMSALHTTDLRDAERFYGKVFGWDLVRTADPRLCEWRLGGRRVAVATLTDGQAVPVHWAVNFAAGDVDEFAQQAKALGATLLVAPVSTPGFRSAVIADPQGGVFAISAPRP